MVTTDVALQFNGLLDKVQRFWQTMTRFVRETERSVTSDSVYV